MSDVRGWIMGKLDGRGYFMAKLPSSQLEIKRRTLPDVKVLAIGLEDGEVFDDEDVDAAINLVPDTRFVAVVPTRITHAAYERAEELGICVAGFGELQDALADDEDIAKHVDSQERYERRRIGRHRTVESLKRKGHHAYEVRRKGLRPLTIITTNDYEFTADQMYTLLEEYDGIEPDLVVVTNPNCHGFSTESLLAAEHAGVSLVKLDDFLAGLSTEWT